ncbi:hypothetical protein HanPSC8_Chr01g0034721 [Helianthus annuus]|nr:hypothetical protein HanPSC8_Chr01g0034721 [Helianthus annuus]
MEDAQETGELDYVNGEAVQQAATIAEAEGGDKKHYFISYFRIFKVQ